MALFQIQQGNTLDLVSGDETWLEVQSKPQILPLLTTSSVSLIEKEWKDKERGKGQKETSQNLVLEVFTKDINGK